MNYYDEVDAYHPRYAHTEYLTYEQKERRRRKRAIVGTFVAAVCIVGLVYFFG